MAFEGHFRPSQCSCTVKITTVETQSETALLIGHRRLFMDRLCNAFVIVIFLVLDAVQFIIESHQRGSHYSDFQSGRTVTEIEKPIPRIQMQGALRCSLHGATFLHFCFCLTGFRGSNLSSFLGVEGVVDLHHNFEPEIR